MSTKISQGLCLKAFICASELPLTCDACNEIAEVDKARNTRGSLDMPLSTHDSAWAVKPYREVSETHALPTPCHTHWLRF